MSSAFTNHFLAFLERNYPHHDPNNDPKGDVVMLNGILKVITLIPALVHWAEQLFGSGKGSDKAAAVLNIAQTLTDEIPDAEIKDKASFKDGLKKINDGVVECLNASLWHE